MRELGQLSFRLFAQGRELQAPQLVAGVGGQEAFQGRRPRVGLGATGGDDEQRAVPGQGR